VQSDLVRPELEGKVRPCLNRAGARFLSADTSAIQSDACALGERSWAFLQRQLWVSRRRVLQFDTLGQTRQADPRQVFHAVSADDTLFFLAIGSDRVHSDVAVLVSQREGAINGSQTRKPNSTSILASPRAAMNGAETGRTSSTKIADRRTQ